MSARIDMSGQRVGRWLVISYAGQRKWQCLCDCGTEKQVEGSSLRRGATQGCVKCHPAIGMRRTHGQKRTRLYSIWSGMKARCLNPREEAYANYGGRGISICSEWLNSFEAFRDWALANGYEPHLTIDRRDNSEGYAPENCHWATYAEQNRNYRRNRPIEFRGRTVLVCDLAGEVGIPQDVLKGRIFRYGWPVEEAISTPVMKRGARRQAVSFDVERRNIDAGGKA